MSAEEASRRRRMFAPVVLIGLVSTALAALAGHQAMLVVPDDELQRLGLVSAVGQDVAQAEFPLAGALALVAIACWGVLLVARGWLRQLMAVLAALEAGGVFAVLVVGGFLQKDDAASSIINAVGNPNLAGRLPLSWTVWFWVGLVASVVAVVAAVTAVLYAPSWPEMGSKYDAPTSHEAAGSDTPAEERTSLDLWKSMDEGDDPTDRRAD